MRQEKKNSHRRGLSTLHIVLIVVGIVVLLGCLGLALLAGIMLPAIGKARQAAQEIKSTTQLRQIESGREIYLRDVVAEYGDLSAAPDEAFQFARLIEGQYMTAQILDSPYDGLGDAEPQYWVLMRRPALDEVSDPSKFIVSYDQVMYAEAPKIPACFLDGNCDRIPRDEFEALLAHPVNAGRDFELPAQTTP